MVEKQLQKAFVQTNRSQLLGALLSKYSIERATDGAIPVEILQAEDVPAFQNFEGKTYLQGSEERTYSLDDEQSFTLTRFMPPELMNFQGRALVIDPDVFAVQDIRPLFDLAMGDAAIACCSRDGAFWDTSVMLLENSRLDWKIEQILDELAAKKLNYNTAVRKLFGLPVEELPRIWNQLDEVRDDTKLIHYTRQRTQPWKTGLPFTVTPRKLGKFLGIIPKEWLPFGKEKYPTTYQPHPDKEAGSFFFELIRDAISDGAISEEQIREEIMQEHVRPDILKKVSGV